MVVHVLASPDGPLGPQPSRWLSKSRWPVDDPKELSKAPAAADAAAAAAGAKDTQHWMEATINESAKLKKAVPEPDAFRKAGGVWDVALLGFLVQKIKPEALSALATAEADERGPIGRVGCVSRWRTQQCLSALDAKVREWLFARYDLSGFFDALVFAADLEAAGGPVMQFKKPAKGAGGTTGTSGTETVGVSESKAKE